MPTLEFNGARISLSHFGMENYRGRDLVAAKEKSALMSSCGQALVIQLLSDTPGYGPPGTLILCTGEIRLEGIEVGSEVVFVPGSECRSHPSVAEVLYIERAEELAAAPIPNAGTYPGFGLNLELNGRRISPSNASGENFAGRDLSAAKEQASRAAENGMDALVLQFPWPTLGVGPKGSIFLCTGDFLLDGVEVGSDVVFVPGTELACPPSITRVLFIARKAINEEPPVPAAGAYPGYLPNLEYNGRRITPNYVSMESFVGQDLAAAQEAALRSLEYGQALVIQLLASTRYGPAGTLILCTGEILLDGIGVDSEVVFVPGSQNSSFPCLAKVLFIPGKN